jgi:branched-chain amino acid transport system substrate-binding protein
MITKNSLLGLLIAFLTIALFISGCSRTEQEVYKIGVIYPLTGEASFWGNNARNGAELAADDFNAQGGIEGRKIQVIFEDSKSVPKDAVNAANKLIFQDKVKFIVGDLASSNLLAIAPICEENKVLTIGQGSNPKLRESGDYIFRTWPSDDLQGRAVAKFINDNLSPKNPSIIYVSNEYGRGVFDVVSNSLSVPLIKKEGYDPSLRDFKTVIQKITRDTDVLILVSYPEELPIILKQLGEAQLAISVVGTETFENENVKKIAVPYPVYYTIPRFSDTTSSVYKDFAAKYRSKFGKEVGVPADPAYDAMMLILQGIKNMGYDPTKVKDYLYRIKGYQGVSGTITFDKFGDVIKPFWVKKIQAGKESVVSEVQF